MVLNEEKLLVIAPHADDEILGCFGLIDLVKKNGGKVYLLTLTLGGYQRTDSKDVNKEEWKDELNKVIDNMGIDGSDIMFCNDQLQWLDRIPVSEIIGYIESRSPISLFNLNPTIVAIPTIFASHQDHTQGYKASISALRHNPHHNYKPPKMILSYESPEYNFWSPYIEFGRFAPNFYIKFSAEVMNKKVSTFEIYKSQIKDGTRGNNSIRALATLRGNEVGAEYAEAFHIHRFVV